MQENLIKHGNELLKVIADVDNGEASSDDVLSASKNMLAYMEFSKGFPESIDQETAAIIKAVNGIYDFCYDIDSSLQSKYTNDKDVDMKELDNKLDMLKKVLDKLVSSENAQDVSEVANKVTALVDEIK